MTQVSIDDLETEFKKTEPDEKEPEKGSEGEGKRIPEHGEPEHTAEELRAMEHGWRPKEEWEGDPSEWVSAKEFNFRGELMGRITQMGKKIGSLEEANQLLQKTVRGFTEAQKEMAEKAYQRAVRDLRREKAEAMREGDYEAAEEVDERLDELKEKRSQMKEEPVVDESEQKKSSQPDLSQLSPYERAFVDYVNTEPRFRNNDALVQELAGFADDVLARGEELTTLQFIQKVDEFASKKTGARRGQVTQPEGRSTERRSRKGSSSKFTKADLSEMELEFAKTFVDTGAHKTLQDAIDSMAEAGALEIQQR